ncbi:MAG: hypothetical protein IPJ65_29800 [Archangiaceae bacterium]|nr:hypothetical protein [Archangiaceae bacterium]
MRSLDPAPHHRGQENGGPFTRAIASVVVHRRAEPRRPFSTALPKPASRPRLTTGAVTETFDRRVHAASESALVSQK